MSTDSIRRHLQIISESLDSLEYLLDMEIVGEDCRHLGSDIKSARRELINLDADKIEEAHDLKYTYDQLRRVEMGLKVLRNNLDRCAEAIDSAIDSANAIANQVESPEDEEL